MKIAIRYYSRSKKGNTKKLANTVSDALGIPALEVDADLTERVDRLFLLNAMYASDVDAGIKEFLARNRDKIGEVINMNTSATGRSTRNAIKRETDKLGIALSEKEFHCAASWIFINKGLPSDDDLNRAAQFAKSLTE